MSKHIAIKDFKDMLLQLNSKVWLERGTVIAILKGMANLPTVNVIRCGKCMHNGSYDTDCPFGWINGEWNMPKPCDFCSYGEEIDNE